MSVSDRLQSELDLLRAMYPDEILFTPKSRELRYDHDHSTLVLRLTDQYPVSGGPPELISANDSSKDDIRPQMRAALRATNLVEGEEALDAIIASFLDVVAQQQSALADTSPASSVEPKDISAKKETKTTIIWLHHLLATSKRKHALSPDSNHEISGITKPGYPGIMIFSGCATAVDEHVNSLKRLNWQAFQVRYESEGGHADAAWEFEHGIGVREVETMAEVVKEIVGEERKEDFLKAAGVK